MLVNDTRSSEPKKWGYDVGADGPYTRLVLSLSSRDLVV